MLGLSLNDEAINIEKRKTEIEQVTLEMRDYLRTFKEQHPYIVGCILCGSRMNPKKMPGSESDIDVILILEEGYSTDSHVPQGREVVESLVGFTQKNKTSSGFEVELDGFYTVSEFQEDMESDEYKKEGKMVWGWNPSATRYIGDCISLNQNKINEDGINTYIKKHLRSKKTELLKQKIIQEKKEEMKLHAKNETQISTLKIGEIYRHDHGLHYQLESIGIRQSTSSQNLLDVTGYEKGKKPRIFNVRLHSQEELDRYVLYTQLEAGLYPAGQQWVRTQEDFLKHFQKEF